MSSIPLSRGDRSSGEDNRYRRVRAVRGVSLSPVEDECRDSQGQREVPKLLPARTASGARAELVGEESVSDRTGRIGCNGLA